MSRFVSTITLSCYCRFPPLHFPKAPAHPSPVSDIFGNHYCTIIHRIHYSTSIMKNTNDRSYIGFFFGNYFFPCNFYFSEFFFMYVLKRDGRRAPVMFDKISSRIQRLCYGLNTDFVDYIAVSQKVCYYMIFCVDALNLSKLSLIYINIYHLELPAHDNILIFLIIHSYILVIIAFSSPSFTFIEFNRQNNFIITSKPCCRFAMVFIAVFLQLN